MTATITRPAVFLRIASNPPIRLWTGSFERDLPPDAIETTGGTYRGLGLTDLPVIDRLLGGDAGEYTFAIPGLSEEALQHLDTPDSFYGAAVHVGQAKFDHRWQPEDEVEWVASYEAETFGFSTTTSPDGTRTVQVGMMVSSALTDRRMAVHLHWSEIEQRLISPTDRAFDYVNRYNDGSTRQYPA